MWVYLAASSRTSCVSGTLIGSIPASERIVSHSETVDNQELTASSVDGPSMPVSVFRMVSFSACRLRKRLRHSQHCLRLARTASSSEKRSIYRIKNSTKSRVDVGRFHECIDDAHVEDATGLRSVNSQHDLVSNSSMTSATSCCCLAASSAFSRLVLLVFLLGFRRDWRSKHSVALKCKSSADQVCLRFDGWSTVSDHALEEVVLELIELKYKLSKGFDGQLCVECCPNCRSSIALRTTVMALSVVGPGFPSLQRSN
ncbi:hypothetical protein KCV07_g343, partial [Aureobasidium melanogenum]